jgi:hypothetical protein
MPETDGADVDVDERSRDGRLQRVEIEGRPRDEASRVLNFP